jgi:autotransporter-associated beta strand protein
MPTFPPRKWLLAAVSAFVFASIYFVLTPPLRAASASWNTSPTNGNWVTTIENNWTTGVGTFPGSTTGTTNGDSATFGGSNITTITLNSSVNIKNINFVGTTAPAYTIGTTGGNALLLTSGGAISIQSTVTGANNVDTVNAPLVLEPGSNVTPGGYTFSSFSGTNSHSLTIAGTVTGGTTTQNVALSLDGSNVGPNAVTGSIGNGSASGGVSLTKNGVGTWTLSGSGANTYTGKTTVTAGTLFLNKTAGVDAISSTGATGTNATNTDLQITGGTVQLNASNQIIDSAKVGLSGGTLKLNGVSEGTTAPTGAGVGAVTLSSNSIIDLANTSVLHFADSSGQTWNGTLSIYNYSGVPYTGNGSEQLLFGSNGSGLTQAQLNSISFYSGAGTGFLGTGGFAPDLDGEVVPVPEPSTWIGAALALAALGFTQRKRLRASRA